MQKQKSTTQKVKQFVPTNTSPFFYLRQDRYNNELPLNLPHHHYKIYRLFNTTIITKKKR